MHRSSRLAPVLALLAGCSTGCSSGATPAEETGSETGPGGDPSSFPGTSAPTTTAGPDTTAATDTGVATDSGETGVDTGADTGDSTTGDDPLLRCPTEFHFDPPPGGTAPKIAGEWQAFNLATATVMRGPDDDGIYHATALLPPGLQAYKVVYDLGGEPQWVLDPGQGRRKYLGGLENSAVLVPDCRDPALVVESKSVQRPAPGQGSYAAVARYVDGLAGAGPEPAAYTAVLRDSSGKERALSAAELKIDDTTGDVTIAVAGLPDGKHRITVTAAAGDGRSAAPLRLIFWVEAEPFQWDDALIYMVMTDRFVDGDPGNNPGATAMADPRGDWQGGDLQGLRAAIADGTLDKLGVRAIWLTPFQTGPDEAFLASDGKHLVTGYHGYWPIRAREVDARIGGAEALQAMVREAHKHGIRVLQDYVVNHVHEQHEYFTEHPEWFRTGCVCGTNNCDWTGHALDCLFSPYLPDINHTVPEANAAFVADAVYWLDEFDLDGLRVDAVKHVEEVATRNLAAAVRETFEPGGSKYFLMGETAMGWSDCADPCNDENYGTIARYIGPFGLDGQFDFVLYHGVSYRSFAYQEKGMLHADYWTQHGLEKWPVGAIMTPYIGSHDTARFVSLADYRGQDAGHDPGIPGNQWDNIAKAPGDVEPQLRMRVAMAWLLGLPGAPLLYYGDEYGQWGGADPNNRVMWRDAKALGPDEATTLALVRKLGTARQQVAALRRGAYVPLWADEDTLVFGRKIAAGDAAVVAIHRGPAAKMVDVEVSASLGLAAQKQLKDRLGGPAVQVSGLGKAAFSVPAHGAVILAP
ncbi:alpha-amylase family glycosyl hydrolase [Nannocystis sp.]|uniref:alpha-amylase family glycosyl hydrolase n=1 Tax=Nannocystis sp. TaxID=1962667 RepID=UPI0025DFACBC|nr:alpha-amylase family glycosyl hydrolase [Nannocystis sp.]MBK7824335.1 glycosyl hydrolase [Nannocystis sp.]